MKVTEIEVRKLRYPLEEPIALQREIFIPSRDMVLIKIGTDVGITGIGEAQAFPKTYFKEEMDKEGRPSHIVADLIENYMSPILLGEDPLEIGRLHRMLSKRPFWSGRIGLETYAVSGIEVALWDIAGKVANQPIHRLLGSYRNEIEAYASVGRLPGDALEKILKRCIGEHYRAVKIRLGIDPSRDIETVERAREAVGAEVEIMVDVNAGWNLPMAMRMVRYLEAYDLCWIEEPLSPHHLEAYSRLSKVSNIPIALGEHHLSRYAFRELIARRIGEILQPDIRMGGISECKRLADMANAWGIPIAPHCFDNALRTAATLQFLGCVEDALYFESDVSENPLQTNLLEEPIEVKDGVVEIPNKPGLGVTLNEEIVKKYTIYKSTET